jgi:cytochrome c oxidase subunit III
MKPETLVVDVSALPTSVFGSRDLVWWGTLGFMVIEGFTLLLCVFAAFYLRRNFETWPPLGTPRPSLLLPTINTVMLLATIIPMRLADRAAREWDRESVRRWLWVGVLLTAVVSTLRGFEFSGLHTRWDSTAYGSVIWVILALHTSLVVTDVFETGFLAVIMGRPPVEKKYFVDATNNALYSYFLPMSWLPLYAVLYLWPVLRHS